MGRRPLSRGDAVARLPEEGRAPLRWLRAGAGRGARCSPRHRTPRPVRTPGRSGPQAASAADRSKPPLNTDKCAPQQSFLWGAQGVAPVDDSAQGVLVARLGAWHVGEGEHAETVVEAFQHLLGRHRAETYRREFDGEGDAVEAPAQLGDGGAVAWRDGERRSGRARRARCARRRTDSEHSRGCWASHAASGSGSVRQGTVRMCSPGTPRRCRLVAVHHRPVRAAAPRASPPDVHPKPPGPRRTDPGGGGEGRGPGPGVVENTPLLRHFRARLEPVPSVRGPFRRPVQLLITRARHEGSGPVAVVGRARCSRARRCGAGFRVRPPGGGR